VEGLSDKGLSGAERLFGQTAEARRDAGCVIRTNRAGVEILGFEGSKFLNSLKCGVGRWGSFVKRSEA